MPDVPLPPPHAHHRQRLRVERQASEGEGAPTQARVAPHSALARGDEPPHRLEHGASWIALEDGKHWFGNWHPRPMRK